MSVLYDFLLVLWYVMGLSFAAVAVILVILWFVT